MGTSVLSRLETVLSDVDDWDEVGRAFGQTLAKDEVDEGMPFIQAFAYRLLGAADEEERQAAGGAFAPLIENEKGSFPPAVADIPMETLDVWVSFVADTNSPLAKSRLCDLLWARQHGQPYVHARTAAGAYLELAGGAQQPLWRIACAERALELARAINDKASVAAAVALLVAVVESDVEDEEQSPGVAQFALRPLVSLPTHLRPTNLAELVRSARDRYRGSAPWIVDNFTRLLAHLVEAAEAEALWREQVASWRHGATEVAGSLRYHSLHSALQLAVNYGLTDLAEDIRCDIESMTPAEFDMQEMSADIDIPAGEIDCMIDSVLGVGDWQRVLRCFGAQGPPSGQIEANTKAVLKADERFPMIFPEDVIGSHMALVFRADTPEHRFRLNLARQESYGVGLLGAVFVELLKRFVAKFGQPSEQELAEFLEVGVIDERLAKRCASAVGYYWEGEYDAAGHLLVPRIEAVVRRLCVAVGIPVTTLPQGQRLGGVVTLGLLLERLKGRMDESWRRYLRHVLTDDLGLDIRNQVCHGLIEEVDQVRVVLLIHVLLFLRNLSASQGG
jgi:hypothetical protein